MLDADKLIAVAIMLLIVFSLFYVVGVSYEYWEKKKREREEEEPTSEAECAKSTRWGMIKLALSVSVAPNEFVVIDRLAHKHPMVSIGKPRYRQLVNNLKVMYEENKQLCEEIERLKEGKEVAKVEEAEAKRIVRHKVTGRGRADG